MVKILPLHTKNGKFGQNWPKFGQNWSIFLPPIQNGKFCYTPLQRWPNFDPPLQRHLKFTPYTKLNFTTIPIQKIAILRPPYKIYIFETSPYNKIAFSRPPYKIWHFGEKVYKKLHFRSKNTNNGIFKTPIQKKTSVNLLPNFKWNRGIFIYMTFLYNLPAGFLETQP